MAVEVRISRPELFGTVAFITLCLMLSSMYLMSPEYTSRALMRTDGGDRTGLEQIQRPYQTCGSASSFTCTQRERINRLKTVCSQQNLFEVQAYRGRSNLKFYYSEKYNFSYCKVPKSGCTFWTQLFLVLSNQTASNIFRLKRAKIHKSSSRFLISFTQLKTFSPRMILVSRNPYSRLYSAYLDKIYLGLRPETMRNILHGGDVSCSTNITFEEFLRFVVEGAKKNKTLDRHWAPIFSLCRPCEVNLYRLVKQESFSQDVECIMKELNIEPSKYNVINEALHDHRIEATLPGIVETVYSKGSFLPCIGRGSIAKRVWTSFQIQGYIDENINFPEDKFVSEEHYANSTYLTELILETTKHRPLTKQNSKIQRQQALASAYRTVSQETIRDIKYVYQADFLLYGYDSNPPTLDRSKR